MQTVNTGLLYYLHTNQTQVGLRGSTFYLRLSVSSLLYYYYILDANPADGGTSIKHESVLVLDASLFKFSS